MKSELQVKDQIIKDMASELKNNIKKIDEFKNREEQMKMEFEQKIAKMTREFKNQQDSILQRELDLQKQLKSKEKQLDILRFFNLR